MTLASSLGGLIWLIAFGWVVYDVWSVNDRLSNGYKVIWTIAALLFAVITAIAYYFIEKRHALS